VKRIAVVLPLALFALHAGAEERYAFLERLAELHPSRQAEDALPSAADELSLADGCIVVREADSDVVRHAAADLTDFFRRSMGVEVGQRGPTVAIAVDPTLPKLQSKIAVTASGVRVTGATPREALQGCCRLEDLLSAREANRLIIGSCGVTRKRRAVMTIWPKVVPSADAASGLCRSFVPIGRLICRSLPPGRA